MQEPDCVDIEVFVGVDIAKGDHYACVVTSAGAEVLALSVRNDEAAIGRLIDDAAVHGTVAPRPHRPHRRRQSPRRLRQARAPVL